MAIQRAKANGHIIQSDWNQTDPKKFDYIHNKPKIPDISDVIKSSAQNLSEAQKAQARANIDAIAIDTTAIEDFNNSWEDAAIFVFDKNTKKFKYSGKTFASFEEEITTKILATMRSEMATYVADFVETYMSDIEIEHDDGTTETVSKMIFANGTGTEKTNATGATELHIEETER
jgi:hypothetical protein